MRLLGPMHACLNVDEILRLIVCELIASGGRATTVSLACCCGSFEDPVLDTLWERQDRLAPLLKSLPGDVWDEGKCAVSAPAIYVLFPHLFHPGVSQKTPNNTGVGSIPEVCSKDAKSQRTGHSRRPVFRSSLVSASWHRKRTLASQSEDSRIVVHPREVHSIHPLAPFPKNHRHHYWIQHTRPPQSGDCFNGHHFPNTVPQLGRDCPPLPTKRSDDHRWRF